MSNFCVKYYLGLLSILALAACRNSPMVDFQPSAPSLGNLAAGERYAAPSEPTLFFWVQDIDVKVSSRDLLVYEHIGDLSVENNKQLEEVELTAIARKYQADLVIAESVFEGMDEGIGSTLSTSRMHNPPTATKMDAVPPPFSQPRQENRVGDYDYKQNYHLSKSGAYLYRLKIYRKLKGPS